MSRSCDIPVSLRFPFRIEGHKIKMTKTSDLKWKYYVIIEKNHDNLFTVYMVKNNRKSKTKNDLKIMCM